MLAYVRGVPEGQEMVSLPRAAILRELEGVADTSEAEPTADYTLVEFAALFQRSPVTVRQWCARGEVPGAYKLQNLDWRIPRASVSRYRELQQLGKQRVSVAHLLRR